ncbi:MAG: DUF2339 domain-containing protein [Oligoflexia bacterium]|nr:DUF2339 domain-containing protein [Oligoflexia bacterium]
MSNDSSAIDQRISALELRISQLEKRISGSTSSPAVSPDQPKIIPAPKKALPSQSSTSMPSRSVGAGNILGIVAVLCFVLAAAFFVKLAIDSGWLTPHRQFVMTMLFGAALALAGWQLRKKDPEYSSLLPAAGVVVMYLAAFAGTLYWRLFDLPTAFILVAATSVASLALFNYFRHGIFAVLAVVGTYLVPVLIHQGWSGPEFIALHFLFWDLTFCIIAIMFRERLFIGLAAYLGLLSFMIAAQSINLNLSEQRWFEIYFQAGQFALFALASAAFSIRTKAALTLGEATSFFPLLLIFYAVEYHLLLSAWGPAAPWIALGFGLFLPLLSQITKQKLEKGRLPSDEVVQGFLAVVLFHSLYLEILPDNLKPIAAILLILGWSLMPRSGPGREGILSLIPYLLCVIVIWLEGGKVLQDSYLDQASAAILWCSLGFAAAFSVVVVQSMRRKSGQGMLSPVMLGAASAFVLSALRQIILFVLLKDPPFVVSSVWALYALALLLVARGIRDTAFANVSLGVFAIVSFRIFSVDLSGASAAPRVVALVVIGGILYAGGLVYRQVKSS